MRLLHISALLVCSCVTAQQPAEGLATWRGEPHALEALADKPELGGAPVSAARAWATWATPMGYRLVLSENGRVVLVLSNTYARRAGGKKEDNTVTRFLKSVERTIEVTDALLPPEHLPADRAKPVVVVGTRLADYGGVVDYIAELEPQLASWAAGAAMARSGFTLADPPVGVWIEDPKNTEEWNPESELIHRLAAELLGRHAALLPSWLQVGLAWHIEERVMRSIYCFPYRANFVSIYDHSDWDRALQQMFKKRRKKPFALEEVTAWNPRSGYEKDAGYLAFGVARFLADFRPQALRPILAELNAATDAGRRVPTGEHTWTTDPNYQLPGDRQRAILLQHAGQDLQEELTEYFRRGKRYKPSKKKRGK